MRLYPLRMIWTHCVIGIGLIIVPLVFMTLLGQKKMFGLYMVKYREVFIVTIV